ncbi:hypothetical protein [Streptomyces sp. BV286]|uniref:hypothetical protein n=1 Tax=Streptomyces sp. BV286 TaxID=2849672 RepID=UPI0020C601DD|nr:hypothetical protein [Streptomyces sp. BV286]
MAVNETIIALTRTVPEPTRPVRRVVPPARTAPPAVPVPAAGIGTARSWSTDVAHPLPAARPHDGVRAHAVLQAPEAGLPVLMVEVDRGTDSDDVLAAKVGRYRRYFRLKTKDPRGVDVLLWRTFYPPTGREGHPPVAVVFAPGTRLGEQALKNRMNRVMSLTREIWSGEYTKEDQHDGASTTAGYYDFSDTIPLLFTTLDRLRTDGPHATVWWRCGHGRWETLPDALANPQDLDAWHPRDTEPRRHETA